MGSGVATQTNNHTIRQLTQTGDVTTIAGSVGASGFVDGDGTTARFNVPQGVVADSANAQLYIADSFNHSIRLRECKPMCTLHSASMLPVSSMALTRLLTYTGPLPYTIAVTTVYGNSSGGFANAIGSAARFSAPNGLALDGSRGLLYVADTWNQAIRKIALSTGEVTLLAGSGVYGWADGLGATAMFRNPVAVAVDIVSNIVYVADQQNNAIRAISSSGYVTTAAGLASIAWGAADGAAEAARFFYPVSGSSVTNGCRLRFVAVRT